MEQELPANSETGIVQGGLGASVLRAGAGITTLTLTPPSRSQHAGITDINPHSSAQAAGSGHY